MNALVSSLLRKRYFWIGVLGLALLAIAMLMGLRAQQLLPKSASFALSAATGSALVGCIIYQWALFFTRLAGDHHAARHHYRNHRYVGTAAVYLFVLHAGGIGYALLTVLPVLFLVISITGLFNSEVISLPPRVKRFWGYLHIGLSGLLLPLIAFHVWAALAFK